MHWGRRLNYQSQQRGDDDRTGAKLVNFNVRFAANIKSVVHLFTTGGVLAVAEGCGAAVGVSSFVSRGWRVRRTSTSSRRSRLAAGLMRICLNGLPGLISATVPTGRVRGKMRPIPLVITRSPRLTGSSVGTYFI